MKRHISIFTFLLGAFAAAVLAPDAFAGVQEISGGDYYFDGIQQTPTGKAYMLNASTGLAFASVLDNHEVTFTAYPDPGMKVSNWAKWNGSVTSPPWLSPAKTDDTFTLTGNSSEGKAYLAVNFDYIPLVVKTNDHVFVEADIGILKTMTLPAPSKIGYTGKWKNEKGDTFEFGAAVSGSNFWYEAEGAQKRDFYANLTADWTANTYTIVFNGNGATGGSMSNLSCTYDESRNLTKNSFTRTHYAFTGWNTKADGTGDSYSNGASVRNLTAVNGGTFTLYAQWSMNSYTVKTQVADGSKDKGKTSPASETQNADTTLTITATPNSGYAFAQWNDGSAEAKRTIQVVSNATYEATFTNRVFTMTFDPNGDGATCGETARQIAYLSPIGLDATGQPNPLPEATRYNHTFLGWYTHKTAGEQITENTAEHGTKLYDWITDITLYAHWTEVKAHSITVTCEPAKGGSATITGESVGGKFVDGKEIILTATPSNGYSFARWERGSNAYTDNPLRSKATESADYIAVFTANVYTVYFDANDGQFEDGSDEAEVPYAYGQAFGTFPVCTREGCDLEGWFTGKKAGKRIDAADIFELPDPEVDVLELWAHWTTKPTYTIVFDGNGATNETKMADQKAYCDEGVVLTSNLYARTGYLFEHWTNSAGTVYLDGATVTNLAAATETATLYAVWSPIHYTLAFDPQGGSGFTTDLSPVDCIYGEGSDLHWGWKGGVADLVYFGGWSNAWNAAVYSSATKPKVTDAYDVPNGTNTLKAIWISRLTDYSLAMHCTNLVWNVENGHWWCVTNSSAGYDPSGTCVRGEIGGTLTTTVTTNGGTLAFWWKSTSENQALVVGRQGSPSESKTLIAEAKDQWQFAEIPLLAGYQPITLTVDGRYYTVDIDQMTWTPKPLHPVPVDGEDNVTISSAAVSDGKFTLSFEFDEDFDYLLKTNANLLIDSWGVMEIEGTKTDNILTFKPQIIEGQPQLFYKVETIQKK